MKDIVLSGIFVVLASVAAIEWSLPFELALVGASIAGSATALRWRHLKREVYTWRYAIMVFVTGILAGIFLAALLVGVLGLEPVLMVPFSYFTSQVGAKLTRELAVGESGRRFILALGDWFESILTRGRPK